MYENEDDLQWTWNEGMDNAMLRRNLWQMVNVAIIMCNSFQLTESYYSTCENDNYSWWKTGENDSTTIQGYCIIIPENDKMKESDNYYPMTKEWLLMTASVQAPNDEEGE